MFFCAKHASYQRSCIVDKIYLGEFWRLTERKHGLDRFLCGSNIGVVDDVAICCNGSVWRFNQLRRSCTQWILISCCKYKVFWPPKWVKIYTLHGLSSKLTIWKRCISNSIDLICRTNDQQIDFPNPREAPVTMISWLILRIEEKQFSPENC